MKRMFCFVVVASVIGLGCGKVEKIYDNANYESLTNEKGTISLYSGGKLVGSYLNAKVKYASADSEAVWFTTSTGMDIYWQGHMLLTK